MIFTLWASFFGIRRIMKTGFQTFLIILLAPFAMALADEKTTGDKTPQLEHVQSSTIMQDQFGSRQTMKIESDTQAEELRRKELLEEIRKLYKANFL